MHEAERLIQTRAVHGVIVPDSGSSVIEQARSMLGRLKANVEKVPEDIQRKAAGVLSDGARKAAEIAHSAKDAAVSELLDISRAAFFVSLSPLVLIAALWWWNENAGKSDDTLTTLGLLWAVSRFVIL